MKITVRRKGRINHTGDFTSKSHSFNLEDGRNFEGRRKRKKEKEAKKEIERIQQKEDGEI